MCQVGMNIVNLPLQLALGCAVLADACRVQEGGYGHMKQAPQVLVGASIQCMGALFSPMPAREAQQAVEAQTHPFTWPPLHSPARQHF